MLFSRGFRSLTVMGASLRSKIFSHPDLILSYENPPVGLWSSGVGRGKSENRVTSLLRTVCFVPGEESNYIFSEFDPLNTDTPLLQTLSMGPSVSVLTDRHLVISVGGSLRRRRLEVVEARKNGRERGRHATNWWCNIRPSLRCPRTID